MLSSVQRDSLAWTPVKTGMYSTGIYLFISCVFLCKPCPPLNFSFLLFVVLLIACFVTWTVLSLVILLGLQSF